MHLHLLLLLIHVNLLLTFYFILSTCFLCPRFFLSPLVLYLLDFFLRSFFVCFTLTWGEGRKRVKKPSCKREHTTQCLFKQRRGKELWRQYLCVWLGLSRHIPKRAGCDFPWVALTGQRASPGQEWAGTVVFPFRLPGFSLQQPCLFLWYFNIYMDNRNNSFLSIFEFTVFFLLP